MATMASPSQNDAVEHASVRSSWSAEARPPSANRIPSTPLFTEGRLNRLRQLEANAPRLYPQTGFEGGGPPLATSSDIQAEVRRQLTEMMA